MFRLLRVSGHSLEPEYEDGDFVLVSGIPVLFNRIRRGDVIAFKHHPYGAMIKMVERIERNEEIHVIGTRMDSVDSRQFGAIQKKDVVGKVIFHIKKA